jgi:hypothetical protein
MKATTLLPALLLFVVLPTSTHAQCQISTSTNYAVSYSLSPNSDGTHIFSSVVMDGAATMTMEYPCPDAIITQFNNNLPNISHYPSVQNQFGSIGGWTQGPSFCAECYASYQTNVDSGPVTPAQSFTFSFNGQVLCSTAGAIFFAVPTIFIVEEAVTYTESIGGAPGAWQVIPWCTSASSPPDWRPTIALAKLTYKYFNGLTICSRPKGSAKGTAWNCRPNPSPIVTVSSNPSQRTCTNWDKGTIGIYP